MNWFKDIKLQYKGTFSQLPQLHIITDCLHRTSNIEKDLSSKLDKQHNSDFSSNNIISSNDKTNISELCSPQSICNVLFNIHKSSKIDGDYGESVTQIIEHYAATNPMEMNLPLNGRQESFIELIVSWVHNTKHLSPRDIKLAINILKHEDSINKRTADTTNTMPINNKISHLIKDLLINKYTGNDWYQIISGDKKIKTALTIDDDASNIIDLCFQRYQKFNDKDILNVIKSDINNLKLSPQNINTIYNHIRDAKRYDSDKISFFIDLLKKASYESLRLSNKLTTSNDSLFSSDNKNLLLSDELVSKVCKLLFQVYKSSDVNAKLKHDATQTIKNLINIYPKALSYNVDSAQQSFIDVIISSVKHNAPKKMMLQNFTQDKGKYEDEAKLFIELVQTSIKNNSTLPNNEGCKIVKLLFNMYNSPKTSTVVYDKSVIALRELITQHSDLATIPLSHGKCSLSELIAKSIEKKGKAIKINDAQLATSIIDEVDGDIHTKRTLLELLVKNYKYADRYEVLKKVIDAASPKELNLADADGNTFGHFCIEQYQQPSVRSLYDIKLMQRMLKSNKLDIAAQNDKGETILHLLNLNSYDDRILALDILKNAKYVDADLYHLVNKNGNKFIENIIASFLSGNNGLNEIINLALKACPESFLSVLVDMCNSSNLSKYSEIINIIEEYNNAEDVKSYCIRFLEYLNEKNPKVTRVAEKYLMKHLYTTDDSSVSDYDYADENNSPVHLFQPSAPEEYHSSNTAYYNNLGETMPQNIEVYG